MSLNAYESTEFGPLYNLYGFSALPMLHTYIMLNIYQYRNIILYYCSHVLSIICYTHRILYLIYKCFN